MNICDNKLFKAFKTALLYNGLDEVLKTWQDRSGLDEDKELKELFRNYTLEREKYDPEDNAQIEIIWMICVLLFGDYGTSPRSGWIVDINNFDAFIDKLTETTPW